MKVEEECPHLDVAAVRNCVPVTMVAASPCPAPAPALASRDTLRTP